MKPVTNRDDNADHNPAIPVDGHSLLIGVVGISQPWYYFDDTAKGREAALKWLQDGNCKRVFRTYLDDVTEMLVSPPVPAKLVEKPK